MLLFQSTNLAMVLLSPIVTKVGQVRWFAHAIPMNQIVDSLRTKLLDQTRCANQTVACQCQVHLVDRMDSIRSQTHDPFPNQ